jgi:hypothetical protein
MHSLHNTCGWLAHGGHKQSVAELLPPNLYALQVNPGLGLNVGSWTMG